MQFRETDKNLKPDNFETLTSDINLNLEMKSLHLMLVLQLTKIFLNK